MRRSASFQNVSKNSTDGECLHCISIGRLLGDKSGTGTAQDPAMSLGIPNGDLDTLDMIAKPGSTDWNGSRSQRGTDA